jgi:predicted O-methyltransferase YrrM
MEASGSQIAMRRLFKNRLGYFLLDLRNTISREAHRAYRKWTRHAAKLPVIKLETLAPGEVKVEAPIMDDICLPPFHGPKDHDDYTPLMKIVRSLAPKVVVELGTAHGNAAANICQHSAETKVYTVNAPVEEQTGVITTYELTSQEIGRVYREHGFSDRVVQIFENTLKLDLSKYLPEPFIDLAIIDACHDTDYVINDFHKVRPYVRRGGIVLFHDTYPSPFPTHLDGSYEACLKLRGEGYDIGRIENSWWGVWVNNS